MKEHLQAPAVFSSHQYVCVFQETVKSLSLNNLFVDFENY